MIFDRNTQHAGIYKGIKASNGDVDMVSMKDISAACGVSIATVSKAMNNRDDISIEMKQKIRETAKSMGYFPNSAAKALKTNRTRNLGVLYVDEAFSGLTHDYFAHVLDSFKRKAEENNYDITFINRHCSGSGSGHMSYLEHCMYRGFDGVMIACIDFSAPEVIELLQSDVPIVTIDYLFNNHIAVISDNVTGMKDLVEYIYRMGHRKIAYIHGGSSGSSAAVTQKRLFSFYKATQKLGITVPESYIREAAYRDTDQTAVMTEKLLKLPDPPTCIIYPDDFSAFGGINEINELGLSIPDDISIAGYDGLRVGRHLKPSLTTICQDTRSIGETAAERLISLIDHPRTTLVEQIIVEGKLYTGNSVKDLNK